MGDNISSNNIITDADRLCDDILIYNNEWDMERCNSLYRVNWKKWYISYNNDAEWIYMRSRMEYMNKLLIAYENTFEKKYLKKWDYIFKSLIKYVVMGSGIFCDRFTQRHYVKLLARVPFMKKYYELNRKLDVAIRNFVLCDRLNINLPESKYKNRIIKLIRQNSTYIVNTFNEWDQTSNWGLIAIFSVIYSQCVIKEFADIKKYESLIEVMLNKQFYKDYSHIECSPMYTVQIHLSMLRVLYRFEDILSFNLQIKLRKQCYETYCFLKNISVGNKLPSIGDSDMSDLNTVFYLSENYLFGKSEISKSECDLFTLYPYEMHCQRKIGLLKNNLILKKNIIYPNSGIAKLCNKNIDMHITNGACKGGHEHFDSLSFTFFYQGKPIIIDSGRYTYKDCPERYYLRSEFAHNICMIDDQERYYGMGVWGSIKKPLSYNIKKIQFENIEGIVAINRDDYSKIWRYYLLINENMAVVITNAEQKGVHRVKEKIHIGYGMKISCNNDKCTIMDGNKTLFIQNKNSHITTEKTFASEKYNEKQEIICINFENEFKDYYSSITLISSTDNIEIEEIGDVYILREKGRMIFKFNLIDKEISI